MIVPETLQVPCALLTRAHISQNFFIQLFPGLTGFAIAPTLTNQRDSALIPSGVLFQPIHVQGSGGNDLIVIDREGFNLSLPKGTLPKGRFALGNKAQDNGDRFIYNANTGALFFDPDGRGGTGKTTLANLQPNLNFTHMDVTIV